MAMAQQSSRLGSALLRGASRLFNGAPAPSLLLLSRGFANMKLFVGGLSFRTDEEGLRSAFSTHGEVSDIRIITDRETGRSRGFGFVSYISESDAETALSKMDGHILDGRVIRVDRASSRTPAPRPGGGGGGFSAGSGSSSGFSLGLDSASPAQTEEDWGAIPSNVADVSQNNQASIASDPVPPTAAEAPHSIPGNIPSATFSSSTAELPQNKSSTDWGAIPSNFAVVHESKESTTGGTIPSSAVELPPIRGSTTGDGDWGTILPNMADVPQNKATTGSGDFNSGLASESSTSAFPSLGVGSSPANAFSSSGFGSATSTASSGSSGFDFTNFPAFDSSSYQNEHPLPRRRPRPRPRPIPQSSVPSFNFGLNSSQETRSPFGSSDGLDTGIPKPKGPEFDFGLSGIPSTPLQTEPGARPQGGFDINIPADASEIPSVRPAPPQPKPLGFSIFQPRIVAPEGLPYDTPEADNWSEIGKEAPKLSLSSLYSPLRSFVSKEKELHWDPYDFDEDAKRPEPEVQPDASPKTLELEVKSEMNAAL